MEIIAETVQDNLYLEQRFGIAYSEPRGAIKAIRKYGAGRVVVDNDAFLEQHSITLTFEGSQG